MMMLLLMMIICEINMDCGLASRRDGCRRLA